MEKIVALLQVRRELLNRFKIYLSFHSIDNYFEDGSKILYSGGIEKEYVCVEVEINISN